MAEYYLEFEKPLKGIDEQILELETGDDSNINQTKIIELKKKDKKLSWRNNHSRPNRTIQINSPYF